MREHTGEGQVALGICRAGSHQGVGRKLLIIAVGDDGAVVQPEHKALTGNHFNGLVNHAFLGFGQLQVFLFLAKRHADRQIGVGSGDLDLNDCGLFIDGRKSDIVRRRVKHIAFRSGNLLQVILAQRQHLGLDRAGAAGGQLFHQLIFLVEGRAFFADNILCRVQLKDRTGQVAVLIDGLHDGIAVGILFIRKANQLHAALLQNDVAAHRRVGDIHGDSRRRIHGVGAGHLNTGQKHHRCQYQVKKAFHLEHSSYPPRLLDPDSGGIAGIQIAFRYARLDNLVFAPGQNAGFRNALRVGGDRGNDLADIRGVIRFRAR